jgi:hypothetical protein
MPTACDIALAVQAEFGWLDMRTVLQRPPKGVLSAIFSMLGMLLADGDPRSGRDVFSPESPFWPRGFEVPGPEDYVGARRWMVRNYGEIQEELVGRHGGTSGVLLCGLSELPPGPGSGNPSGGLMRPSERGGLLYRLLMDPDGRPLSVRVYRRPPRPDGEGGPDSVRERAGGPARGRDGDFCRGRKSSGASGAAEPLAPGSPWVPAPEDLPGNAGPMLRNLDDMAGARGLERIVMLGDAASVPDSWGWKIEELRRRDWNPYTEIAVADMLSRSGMTPRDPVRTGCAVPVRLPGLHRAGRFLAFECPGLARERRAERARDIDALRETSALAERSCSERGIRSPSAKMLVLRSLLPPGELERLSPFAAPGFDRRGRLQVFADPEAALAGSPADCMCIARTRLKAMTLDAEKVRNLLSLHMVGRQELERPFADGRLRPAPPGCGQMKISITLALLASYVRWNLRNVVGPDLSDGLCP